MKQALSILAGILLAGSAPGWCQAQPAVASGGVISAGAFGGFTAVAPGSWIEIYGSNLAAHSRSW